ESVILSLVGGSLGVLAAMWGTSFLATVNTDILPRAGEIGLDKRVLGFALVLSLVTGVAFGLAPALQASKPDLNRSLKEGGRGSTQLRHRMRSFLVVFEAAAAIMLLTGAGLLIRSFLRASSVDPGLDPKNVLTMEVSLSPNSYSQASKVRAFYQTVLERAQLLPGVRSAALTTLLPLSGDDNELPFWVSGRPKPATIEQADYAMFYCASTRYFQTMGIRLLRGRVFEDSDSQTAGLVVMIDDQLASQMFKGEDPIGKRIRFDLEGSDQEREIIGLIGHVKQIGLDSDEQYKVQMQIYMPYPQIPDQFMAAAASGMTLAVRTVSDPSGMAAAIRSEVSAIDRNQPIYNLKTMEELAASSIAQRRLSMLLFGGFAAVALLLAAVGL